MSRLISILSEEKEIDISRNYLKLGIYYFSKDLSENSIDPCFFQYRRQLKNKNIVSRYVLDESKNPNLREDFDNLRDLLLIDSENIVGNGKNYILRKYSLESMKFILEYFFLCTSTESDFPE